MPFLSKERRTEFYRHYYLLNREYILAQNRAYRARHRDELNERNRQHRKTNRTAINIQSNAYTRKRKSTDVQYRLMLNLRARLNSAIRYKNKKGSAVSDLGCSIDELKAHLEKQFYDGMTWENYGRNGWHIDHITSLALFDLTNREQFLTACHYTNLQPLWSKENLRKGVSLH